MTNYIWQFIRNDFIVNAGTSGEQVNPTVAATANGGFVVAWESYPTDNTAARTVWDRVFDSNGAPITGGDQHYNQTGLESSPDLVTFSDGRSALQFNMAFPGSGSTGLLTLDGSGVGSPFNAQGLSVGAQGIAKISGTSFAVLSPNAQFTGDSFLMSQFVNSNTTTSSPFTVATISHANIQNADAAASSSGVTAFVWEQYTNGVGSVWFRLVSGTTSIGSATRIGDATYQIGNGDVAGKIVATSLLGGGFAVAYLDNSWGTGSSNITLRIFNSSGVQVGQPVHVSSGLTGLSGDQIDPSITTMSNGMIAVGWVQYNTRNYYVRVFDQSGQGVGPLLQYTNGLTGTIPLSVGFGEITALPGNRLAVVVTGGDTGGTTGIHALEVQLTTPLPDLVVDTLSLSNTSLTAGAGTTVSYHLFNASSGDTGAAAGASTARIYLSTDNVITTSDTVLLSVVFPNSLSPGFFIADSRTVTLPNNLAPGTYYIGVIADFDNQVVESNDNNNASAPVAINVTSTLPDLRVDTLSLSSTTVAAGAGTTVSYHLFNASGGTAAASTARIYLSTDNVITTSDTVLLSVVFPNTLSPGFFIADSRTVTLPSNLAPGTYYIGVIADFDNQVGEWNENNNASSSLAVTVTPANRAPVVTTSDRSVAHGANPAASTLFSVTDADSDPITQYQFFDSTADPASGHWVVSGVAQNAGQYIDVTAAQLAQISFQSGSGSDDLWVRAFDGKTWSAWKEFHVTAATDQAPVVTASDVSLAKGASTTLSASSLFSVSDAENDTITKYQFWDSTIDPGSGQWVVNGAAQSPGQAIDVTAVQLAQTTFATSPGAFDDLWVRASDGTLWSAWKEFHVSGPVNHAPVVAASDRSVAHGANPAASTLFTVTDIDSDTITKYQFYDSTADAASGHWVVNGVAQSASQYIDVTAAQLAQTTFQNGSGSDDLWMRANDGAAWSAWKEFHVNAPIDQAPVVTASDIVLSKGASTTRAASSLFSVTDAENDTITKYQFWDSTVDPGSGRWVVNGAAQNAGQAIEVTAAQLAQTNFVTAPGAIDDLWVRANDGTAWSAWKEFHVTGPTNQAPVVTAADRSVAHVANPAASSLFSVADADSDPITKYQFYDSTADTASGHWMVNGVAQGAGQYLDVTAAQLAQTSFQSGSGSDDLWVRANDGTAWSAWKEFHVNAPIDQKPVVAGGDASLSLNASTALTSLFSVGDADFDAITKYQFWDSNTAPTSGHFAVNGAAQAASQYIDVLAAQIGQTTFVAGSASTVDQIWARANDGLMWSDWHALNVTSHA